MKKIVAIFLLVASAFALASCDLSNLNFEQQSKELFSGVVSMTYPFLKEDERYNQDSSTEEDEGNGLVDDEYQGEDE